MKTMFETLDVMWNLNDDGNIDADRPLIIACKDREAMRKGEERWVLSSLTKTEAKELLDYLQKYL